MKYVRFRRRTTGARTEDYGFLEDATVKVLDRSFLRGGTPTGEKLPLAQVRLLAPVVPRTVVAIGLNYADHAKESGMEVPSEPFLFLKAPGCIIGPEDPIRLAVPENRNDYEAEIVVVVKKQAYRVPEAQALDYVLGYTCGNDVSDRTHQRADNQWVRAKACDTYGPIGPLIADEIDPHNLRIQTRLNGVVKQDSNTNQMVFKVPRLVAHVTKYLTLMPGDVIFTGTPPGIGPMKAGDVVEVEIEGIGTLRNPVVDA